MRHRFLIHALSHTVLVVDITGIGLPDEIYEREGRHTTVPSLRFNSWKDAQRYFCKLGADDEVLERTLDLVKKTGVAALTIV